MTPLGRTTGQLLESSGKEQRVLDLFAGPGGWSQGLRMLGLSDIGIEWDDAACRTRKAAGHLTIRADVATYPVEPFMRGRVRGLIASPPCQDFSLAGKGAGLNGDRGQLVWQALRWALLLTPDWIAFEQVPPVLPIWQSVAHALRIQHGYRTWTGILNAADYGVPQTRKRAFLLAHRSRVVQPPAPTHAKEPSTDLFGGELQPWITMAEALGWPGGRVRDSFGEPALDYAGRADSRWKDAEAVPSPAVTGKTRDWVVKTGANSMKHSRTGSKAGDGGVVPYERPITEPAPTLDSKVGSAWTVTRPATAVCGDPRIFPPGYRGRAEDYTEHGRYTGKRAGDGAIRVSAAEASVLQSFPPDYPWQGSRSKQFEQIGNAVPPLLAAHVLSAVTGIPLEQEAAA